ncbi:MAG: hypothetical protein U1F17_03825 [Burkholderiaceae bacterium]
MGIKMNSRLDLDPQLHEELKSIYEELMWLSVRPNVTPGRARAWYTHIMAEAVKRRLRRFTGKVSETAVADGDGPLMLEHFKRIQTTLTALVARHRTEQLNAPDAFIKTLVEFEQVHIVTRAENYAAMRAKGNYRQAGIVLLPWKKLPEERRAELWRKMLRGKVANADAFKP